MSTLIEFDEVCKYYQMGDTLVKAADHVSFKINKGEFVAIVGQSGSGKSTCMNIIGCLDVPTEGTYLLDGRDVGKMSRRELASIRNEKLGFIFQQYNLLPRLNLLENVEVPLVYANISRAERHKLAKDVLEKVGLGDKLKNLPNQLSGGQQQRVAIARSLVNEPEILLLDEPLGALDLKLRKEMQLELKRLQREMNITFIYVTHDQEEALTMSDTVVVMNGGKVQQIGTPEDIYNEPKNAFVADFIGDSNIVDGVMHRDFLVSFSGVEFPCVDRGFAREESVQVVVRPEDIEVVSPVEGQLVGVVNDVIFKGVHFEMHVECEGREWLIHSTRACTPGETIGMRIGPNEIHIMSRSEG